MLSSTTIQSMGVIKEKNGRYILPIPKQNSAYVIPLDQLTALFFFKNRYTVVLVATVFFYALGFDLIYDAAFLIGLTIIVELYYRYIFINKLTVLKNYKVADVKLKVATNLNSKLFNGAFYVLLAGVVIYLSFTQYAYTNDRYLYLLAAGVILFRGYTQVFKK